MVNDFIRLLVGSCMIDLTGKINLISMYSISRAWIYYIFGCQTGL